MILVDSWFFAPADVGSFRIESQGHVEARIKNGVHMVQFYDIESGNLGERRLMAIEDMMGWFFFDDRVSMQRARDVWVERQR